MLGGVETKNILTLARSGIDRPHMLAPVHFPNCSNHSIFLNGVIGDIFRRRFCGRTFSWCISRAGFQRGFVLRHFYSNTPLKTSLLVLWVSRIVAHASPQCLPLRS